MTDKFSPEVRKQIERGIEVLKAGGVIAFPTETVYGLGVTISIPTAANNIYKIKGRAQTKALPLVLSRFSQFEEVAVSIPSVALKLAERFWPGPLTLVVNKSKFVPDSITSGGKTIAVRITPHPVAIALIEGLGCPITATSANLSGRPSPVTAEEVSDQLAGSVDYIVNGGRCRGGVESTIIDVTGEIPVILREGAIRRDIILQVCNLK